MGTVLIVLILILLTAIAGGIYLIIFSGRPSRERIDPEEYFGYPGTGQTAVATTLGLCGGMGTRVEGQGGVFIPYEDIRTYIADNVYYDESSQTVTVTTPGEIINLSPAEDTDKVVIAHGEVMISSEFLMKVSDIAIEEYDAPSRLVIRCAWDTPLAMALEEAAVRQEPDIKSPILTEVPAGTQVFVLETLDAFSRVSTQDGFTGYVQLAQIGPLTDPPLHENPELTYTHTLLDEKLVMGFHQTDTAAANAAFSYVTEDTPGMNVIAPTWYFLDSTDGAFTDLSDPEYAAQAHAKGLKLFAVINDFDGKLNSYAETAAALSGTPVRQKLEEEIVASALAAGVDGLNLDFENVNEDGIDAFLAFLRELSVLCRRNGLILSSDIYVPEPYNRYLRPEEQAEAADYLLIMAYDEHHRGSETAGSVSSISWIEKAVEGGIAAAGGPERVIVAIPFYTRLWKTTETGAVTCSSMGMEEAEEYVKEHSMKVTWDESVKQNYAVLEGSTKYEIWMEDEQSLTAKMRVISSAGTNVAAWKLGLEDPSAWALVKSFIAPDA